MTDVVVVLKPLMPHPAELSWHASVVEVVTVEVTETWSPDSYSVPET